MTQYGTNFKAYLKVPTANGTMKDVTAPHGSYTVGTVWNDNYNGSTQCAGFARLIFNTWCGTNGTDLNTITPASNSALQTYINRLHPGSRLRAYKQVSSDGHSMVVIDKTSSGIYVYHSNFGEDNKIQITYFSFTDLRNRWNSFRGVTYNGNNYNGSWDVSMIL